MLDRAGFACLEVSGGGCFDGPCARGVESPWERIRAHPRALLDTPLGMALRGRFLVGSRPLSRDLVRRFVASAADSGIDVFRLHDPLNDLANLGRPPRRSGQPDKELAVGLVHSPGPDAARPTSWSSGPAPSASSAPRASSSTIPPARSIRRRPGELVEQRRRGERPARRAPLPGRRRSRRSPRRSRRRGRGAAPGRVRALPGRAHAPPGLGGGADAVSRAGSGSTPALTLDASGRRRSSSTRRSATCRCRPSRRASPCARPSTSSRPGSSPSSTRSARPGVRRPARRGAAGADRDPRASAAGRRSPRRSGRSSAPRRCCTCCPRSAGRSSSTSSRT